MLSKVNDAVISEMSQDTSKISSVVTVQVVLECRFVGHISPCSAATISGVTAGFDAFRDSREGERGLARADLCE